MRHQEKKSVKDKYLSPDWPFRIICFRWCILPFILQVDQKVGERIRIWFTSTSQLYMARHPKSARKNKLKKLQKQTKIIYLCNCQYVFCPGFLLFSFVYCLNSLFLITNVVRDLKILNLKCKKLQQKT